MKKAMSLSMVVVLLMMIITGCNKKSLTESESNTMKDIDGNVYQTVKIGNQVWMAENLKVTHYRDGTPINHVTDESQWRNLSTGAYCAYDNSESTADTYGYLYNWYAVTDIHNIAPKGWRVPTDDDWKELEMFLGLSPTEADDTGWRGSNEGSKLAGNASLWDSGDLENNAAFGESGFSALPGGYRYSNGNFDDLGDYAYFWSATERSTLYAWIRYLHYNGSDVGRGGSNKQGGFSVRLVRD